MLYVILIYLFHALLVRQAVPDAVASQHDKLVSFFSLCHRHIWVTWYCLVLLLQVWLVFVLEISKGSAQSQISVHSRVLDPVVSIFDSLQLLEVIRLVVFAERNCFVIRAQHWPAVTCICTINLVGIEVHHIGSATSVLTVLFLFNKLVKLQEGLNQGIFEIAALEGKLIREAVFELLACKLGNLFSTVTVPNAIKHALLSIVGLSDLDCQMIILLTTPPALHGAQTPAHALRGSVLRILILDGCFKIRAHNL